jgi:hypothetical protein
MSKVGYETIRIKKVGEKCFKRWETGHDVSAKSAIWQKIRRPFV